MNNIYMYHFYISDQSVYIIFINCNMHLIEMYMQRSRESTYILVKCVITTPLVLKQSEIAIYSETQYLLALKIVRIIQEFMASVVPHLILLIDEVLMKKTRDFQRSILFNPGKQ